MPSNKGVDCGEIDEQACTSTSSKTSDQQTVQNNHLLKDNSSPHQSLDEPNAQEFLNSLHQQTLSDEDESIDPKLRNSQFIWTSPMVYGLIEEYQKLIVQFRDPKLRQKDLWIKVANGMRLKGFNVDYQMCDRKWRNLKQTFKSIYYDRRKKRQRTWEFYEILQIIFAPDPRNNTRILRKSRLVPPIPENEDNDDGDNDNLLAPVQKRKRIRYSKTDYYTDHTYQTPNTEAENQTVIYNQMEISRDCTEEEEEEENEDPLPEEITFEELEVHYKEVEGPAWFRTAMENLRADQRARVAEARRMHRELLDAEKRKCDLLEALLRVLQPPQG